MRGRTRRLALVAILAIISITTILTIRAWWNASRASSLQDLASKSIISYPRCAPWIPEKQRVIAFDKTSWMQTWKAYHTSTRVYHGGEAYWSASLDYALQQLGFRVVRRHMDPSLLKAMRDDKIFKFVYNSNAPNNYPQNVRESPLFQNSNITCRFHFFDYWAGDLHYNVNGKREQETYNPFPSDPIELGYDARHVLAPLPGSTNTPLHFFVHSQVTLPSISERKKKPRAGFLLSKHCSFDVSIVRALLDHGFTLHTTCFEKENQVNLESTLGNHGGRLVHHSKMLPSEFSWLMRDVAFMIGFGEPLDSPSPYEALANGAAFLQMHCECSSKCRVDAIQHRSLRNLGFPYVYKYRRDCNDSLAGLSAVEAAERAYDNPFASYVPFQHSLGTILSQVCHNLIENTALCGCARLQEQLGTDSEGKLQEIRKCRSGSFYELPID